MVEKELTKRAAKRLAIHPARRRSHGSVAMTCRYYGISRACFHIWLGRYREFGADGMRNQQRHVCERVA